ncbi:sodium:solute symporter family protein [Streptomyces luteolus]|uniref:Sodium:solute symporter family protein n=1 Tax=Streptomyces luteolus TaxID=3043615 RepID=A0ABT6T330_9ACTN|nr:sodium:solute symporter family protein [Streptomyces sp. B-S-A12]MDI3422045.1 sodium:solute symporter family protein [Streptomyces sp. B-S-A12]
MFIAGVIGSFLLYLVIGAVVGRRVKDRSDYFVAGRRAPTLLVAGTLVASFLSTVAFMGEVGFAYDGFPVVLLIVTALNISGYVVGVLGFGRYLRRSEVLTVPEYFGKRFDSRAVQSVSGVMVVVGIGFYLIAVTHGLALVMGQLLGWETWVSVLVVWLGYTVFTFMSGSQGILINDTIMFFIFMLAGVGGMSYVVFRAGGPTEVLDKLRALPGKPDGLSWHGVTGEGAYLGSPGEVLVWALAIGLVWMAVVAVSPWQSSRYLMARDEHVSLRSAFISMGTVGVLYVFLAFGAYAINFFKADINPSEVAFIWAAQNLMPPVLGVIAVTGIVAAGLSSASSFLALIGFSVAHDVLPQSEDATVPEHVALRRSRLVMLAVGVVVLLVTLVTPPAVLTIGYFAATLFAAAWGPVAFWSIRSENLSARGALAGMVAGFVGVGVFSGLKDFAGLDLPIWAHPVFLGFALSMAATWIADRGVEPSPAAKAFRAGLLATPAAERHPRKLRRTSWIATGTTAAFVAAGLGLLAFYGIPLAL